jgi:ribosomal protein S18 acetylase RimI-like enzyme
MTEIAIRRALADDARRLNEALHRLSENIGDRHSATAASLRTAGFGENPVFRAVIAEKGAEVVGAALYSPIFSTVRGGTGVYVSDLWVSPSVRGQGLGRRLLGAVAGDSGNVWGAGFLKLVVYDDNSQAHAFYERLGFAASHGEIILTLDDTGLAALKDK